jgi:hypothetical protein
MTQLKRRILSSTMNFQKLAFTCSLCLAAPSALWAADATTNSALPVPPAPKPPPFLVSTVVDAPALPVAFAATDPKVCYIGRFDLSKGDPRCSWTASTITLKFQGTDLNAQMEDGGASYWEVELDGQPMQKMALGTGSHLYKIASGLNPGTHTVRLVRASEASMGSTQIHGFQLNQDGSLLPGTAPAHRLEVIGDSISCGALNEGLPGHRDPANVTENGYFSYGEITARDLGLAYHCVSWSGWKMWPNKTIPSIYNLTIPTEKDTIWDFAKWNPDAILINLSTNDFNNRPPIDEPGWTAAYEKFVTLLRSHFHGAEIYCATSPMMTGDKLALSKTWIQKVVSDLNAAGDSKVKYFEFDTEDPKDGIGGSHHPNVKTDQIMGDKLAAQLTMDLGWTNAGK